jgi:hypothetical protein
MKSKYSNKIVTIDGLKFRSIREGNRYKLLKELEKRGEITNLVLQPKFVLVEDKSIGFKLTYVADFQYTIQGVNVVEDVKGMKTNVYKQKKKLMLKKYGIAIKEVR